MDTLCYPRRFVVVVFFNLTILGVRCCSVADFKIHLIFGSELMSLLICEYISEAATTYRRLGAKGSYLTLVRVADRIL